MIETQIMFCYAKRKKKKRTDRRKKEKKRRKELEYKTVKLHYYKVHQ